MADRGPIIVTETPTVFYVHRRGELSPFSVVRRASSDRWLVWPPGASGSDRRVFSTKHYAFQKAGDYVTMSDREPVFERPHPQTMKGR